jgi:hypothetical protein
LLDDEAVVSNGEIVVKMTTGRGKVAGTIAGERSFVPK